MLMVETPQRAGTDVHAHADSIFADVRWQFHRLANRGDSPASRGSTRDRGDPLCGDTPRILADLPAQTVPPMAEGDLGEPRGASCGVFAARGWQRKA